MAEDRKALEARILELERASASARPIDWRSFAMGVAASATGSLLLWLMLPAKRQGVPSGLHQVLE